MIAENLVMKFALADRRTVKLAPAIAGGIKAQLDLIKNLASPVFVKPRRARKVVADAGNELVCLGESGSPVRGAS